MGAERKNITGLKFVWSGEVFLFAWLLISDGNCNAPSLPSPGEYAEGGNERGNSDVFHMLMEQL